MFVSDQYLISSGSDLRPGHGSEIQVVKFVRVDLFSICIFLSFDWDVTSKKVHVILVNARAMICNTSRNVLGIACCLDLSPTMIALNWVTAWTVKLILVDLAKTLQTQLKE